MGTLSTVVDSESVVMVLWKHECTRVFSDRMTLHSDKDWFTQTLVNVIEEELGEKFVQLVEPNSVFVDFMRYLLIILILYRIKVKSFN